MLLRNFIIYCLVMGLFTAIFSKLVIEFRLESTGLLPVSWTSS